MTEFINLLNIIGCNFNTDNNIEIQKDHLKMQLKSLEEIHNNFHKSNDCDCMEYLIKKELISKTIKYLESILLQVMSESNRKLIKEVQEMVDKELVKKNKRKNKGESSSSNNNNKSK